MAALIGMSVSINSALLIVLRPQSVMAWARSRIREKRNSVSTKSESVGRVVRPHRLLVAAENDAKHTQFVKDSTHTSRIVVYRSGTRAVQEQCCAWVRLDDTRVWGRDGARVGGR